MLKKLLKIGKKVLLSTMDDEDWKECFIHYANKTYGDIDEDELE